MGLHKGKRSTGIIILLFFVVLVFLLSFKFFTPKVNLIFVGDIMLSRHIGNLMQGEGDWKLPFRLIKGKIEGADIASGNLEGPISIRGFNSGSQYSFRSDPKVIDGLNFAGFDVLSLANNHMLDWGVEALQDTITNLKKSGIKFAGAGTKIKDVYSPTRISVKGINFAFLAYSEFSPSNSLVARFDIGKAVETIKFLLKDGVDIVAISIHWGEEYKTIPEKYQEKIAHELINAGASIVVGHHPHVVQKVERFGKGIIAYSLGNFVFDQNFSPDTGKGLLLEVSVGKGKIFGFTEYQIGFSKKFQPYLKEEGV